MIKAVFFDLDDTLLWDEKSIDQAFKETCRYAQTIRQEIDPIELETNVRHEAKCLYESYGTYPFTKVIGINPFEGLWGQFRDDMEGFEELRDIAPTYQLAAWARGLEATGVNDTDLANKLAVQFPLERRKHPFVYDETFEVLDELHQSYKLFLLTNGSPDLQNTKLEMTPQLVPYFDHILISGAYGKGKPDLMLFNEALRLANLSNEEVLMVGDNLHTDITGANAAGIKTVWVNRKGMTNHTDIRPSEEVTNLHQLKELALLTK